MWGWTIWPRGCWTTCTIKQVWSTCCLPSHPMFVRKSVQICSPMIHPYRKLIVHWRGAFWCSFCLARQQEGADPTSSPKTWRTKFCYGSIVFLVIFHLAISQQDWSTEDHTMCPSSSDPWASLEEWSLFPENHLARKHPYQGQAPRGLLSHVQCQTWKSNSTSDWGCSLKTLSLWIDPL